MLCYFVRVFDDNLGSTQTRFLAVMLILKEHSQLLKKCILNLDLN
jgi:hypothetical protein